ncbi:MAG: GIY-YIG nuclease family protein [Gammaproteobacteria bacterium]|nr:GIY-YIG nuclease family protein [Gammaproteobacteria bacterium]
MNPRQSDWFNDQLSSELVLSEGFPEKLAIVDCETTGGKPTFHRVIEVAVVLIDDGKETKRWKSFINPGVPVPEHITGITGIRDSHLTLAPSFEEIASELQVLLSDRVLVAHNARFDYGFLRNEFQRAEIKYSSKLLCSVKFSRVLFPHFKRHSLDAIIKRFALSMEDRHRAMDDALAVFQFFNRCSSIFSAEDIAATCDQIAKTATLPVNLSKREVDKLPNSPGVYYFYDDKSVLLYVGKSVNIKTRVLSHFSQDHKNYKDLKMSQRIARVDYDLTPSDFGAQILEAQQVKELMPSMNRRLRRVRNLWQIRLNENNTGFLTPQITMVETSAISQSGAERFGLFRSKRQAQKKIENIADEHHLCHRLLGLESGPSNRACFRYQLKKCAGACCGEEDAHEYNTRILDALDVFQLHTWPWQHAILVKEPCTSGETCDFHLIENWIYRQKIHSEFELAELGYSPIQDNNPSESDESLFERSRAKSPTESKLFDLDVYFILIRFLFSEKLRKTNRLKIIELEPFENHEDSEFFF